MESFNSPYVRLIVVCKICSKEQSMKNAGHWKRHYFIHVDEKPHKCIHCPKSFVEADKLRHHIRKVHESGTKTGVSGKYQGEQQMNYISMAS